MTVPILVAFSAVLYFLSFAVSAFAKQNRSRLKLSSILRLRDLHRKLLQ